MNRSWCNWINSLTNMKLWERLDDMDIAEQTQPSRASSRSRDRVAFHITRSSAKCLLALTLILLSVTLYLDRTLEPPVGWQLHTNPYQRQGSAQTNFNAEAAAAVVGENNSNRPRINLQDSSLGREPRLEGGALLGMGITFRKGSRAMSELVVAHLQDTTTPTEFKLFLRTLHRSGVTGRADVVFLFPFGGPLDDYNQLKRILHEEERSFWRIMQAQQSSMPTHHHTRKNSKKSSKRSSKNSALLGQTNHTSDTIFMMPNSSITEFWAGPPFRRLNAQNRKGKHSQRSDRTNSSPSDTIHRTLSAPVTAADRRDSTKWNHTSSGPSEILKSTLSETPASERRDSKRLRTHINSGPSETNFSTAWKMPKVPICPFNFLAFWESREEGLKGKGRRLSDSVMRKSNKQYVHGSGSTEEDMTAAVKWGDWGSTTGFEMQDLEQDEAIAGFIDNPPSQLRRWMCYKMLLGMVKRQYQNVLLTEVSEVFILGDIMAPTRDPAFASSVYLFSEDRTWNEGYEASRSRDLLGTRYQLMSTNDQDGVESFTESSRNGSDGNGRQQLAFVLDVYGKEVWKKLEEEDKQRAVLSSGIIMGNMKSIQALSNAMLTEIVRVAILRKSREPFHDQPLLNYVVQKSGILNKKVLQKLSVVSSRASLVHTLPGSIQKSLFMREEGAMFDALQGLHHGLVLEETRKAITESIHTDICSSQGGLGVYEDCAPSP